MAEAMIREIAQSDDRHMDIICGWATGNGAEAFSAWLAAHEVGELTSDEWEAITGFDTNTADLDLDAPVVVVAGADASYGGGAMANHWYLTADGAALAWQSDKQVFYRVSAADLAAAPAISDYAYTG